MLFLPVSAQYAGEIRMYSLGMLLGTIMCIYAYRIYKKDIHKLTYVFFGVSSLLLAYTHYYGVLLAGVINLALFVYLIKKKRQKARLNKIYNNSSITSNCVFTLANSICKSFKRNRILDYIQISRFNI